MTYFRVPNPDDEGLPADVCEPVIETQDGEVIVRLEELPNEDSDPVLFWCSPDAAMRIAGQLIAAAHADPRQEQGSPKRGTESEGGTA